MTQQSIFIINRILTLRTNIFTHHKQPVSQHFNTETIINICDHVTITFSLFKDINYRGNVQKNTKSCILKPYDLEYSISKGQTDVL